MVTNPEGPGLDRVGLVWASSGFSEQKHGLRPLLLKRSSALLRWVWEADG